MKKTEKQTIFTHSLIAWNNLHNKRVMPWKGEKDPYKIWLSEVILQQTRVEQGLEYYNRFIKKYPSVEKLAGAEDNDVFKLWEGLGYYSRCRNLLASARNIAFDKKGKFPDNFYELLLLKGVGPYTAAAIASFAYGHPYAVTDGNVYRVLARFFGISDPIDSTAGKKKFAELAQTLLDKINPAAYNQAIMDFGAVICKPKLPLCSVCILRPSCSACKENSIGDLPVTEKKLTKKHRRFFYIIAGYGGKIYARQRTGKDIWQNLWEFILIETDPETTAEKFLDSTAYKNIAGKKAAATKVSEVFKQQLTHQTVEAVFINIQLSAPLKDNAYSVFPEKALQELAFPGIINSFLGKGQRKFL